MFFFVKNYNKWWCNFYGVFDIKYYFFYRGVWFKIEVKIFYNEEDYKYVFVFF